MAIARALANEPPVLLADEPTGNLDSAATADVLRLFEGLRAAGQTVVIVTHDARIAATADRLVSMRDGAFVDDTRLAAGSAGRLGDLIEMGTDPVGRVLLVFRLVLADVRRHPAQAAMLVVAVTAATAALALGLSLRGGPRSSTGRPGRSRRGRTWSHCPRAPTRKRSRL